jgi:hypothetical protein
MTLDGNISEMDGMRNMGLHKIAVENVKEKYHFGDME